MSDIRSQGDAGRCPGLAYYATLWLKTKSQPRSMEPTSVKYQFAIAAGILESELKKLRGGGTMTLVPKGRQIIAPGGSPGDSGDETPQAPQGAALNML